MESTRGSKTQWTPERQNTRHVGIYCIQIKRKKKKQRINMTNEP